jgi:hypothetical protein
VFVFNGSQVKLNSAGSGNVSVEKPKPESHPSGAQDAVCETPVFAEPTAQAWQEGVPKSFRNPIPIPHSSQSAPEKPFVQVQE